MLRRPSEWYLSSSHNAASMLMPFILIIKNPAINVMRAMDWLLTNPEPPVPAEENGNENEDVCISAIQHQISI